MPLVVIKNRLFELRMDLSKQRGREITQTEMAKNLGMSQPQYSRYESQQRQPHIEVAVLICRKLGITLNDLIYWHESPEQ
jgi:DNA-binding XRE family transcriptional regulator